MTKFLFEDIDIHEEWREEWNDMPEYKYSDEIYEYQKILVHFKTEEDLKKFAKLIGQKISHKTDSIWYPQRTGMVGLYIDES